ncbi:hypothetical protein HU200_022308 [Digitaria exilis]|uniref:C2H2-type domain-containing protein n=1 Tax=Digitaria exilis TaxID=1010633 RepID=A0A835K8K7_9POAL|nr:hypothetical protein HU200_022308 [Digitaria exilis]
MFVSLVPLFQVHQPLPPPPPLRRSTRAKRLLSGPPPGFSGVHQPPRKSPFQRAPAPPQPQPAPNPHRAPGTSSLPPPVHASHGALLPLPATDNTVKPPLQRRSAPRARRPRPGAKKRPTVPCELCGVLCMTAWHLKQHEQGRRHRNMAAQLAGDINVRCPVCNVHLSSGLNVEQHFAGKQHRRQLRIKGGT